MSIAKCSLIISAIAILINCFSLYANTYGPVFVFGFVFK